MKIKNISIISLIVATMVVPAFSVEGTFETVKTRASKEISNAVSLTLRQRAIVEISQLSALGMNEMLSKSVTKALKEDLLSKKEVALILTQLSSYYGFPRAEKSMNALKGIIEPAESFGLPEDTVKDRIEAGRDVYTKLDANGYNNINTAFNPIGKHLPKTTFALFGDAFSNPSLPLKDRQLATISALASMGTANPQLRFHITTSLNIGVTKSEIVDMIVMTQYYAGMPAAYNAALAAKEVFQNKPQNPYIEK
ncbi:MAG: carboxymuconolactone decarboxylase family protein [Akkermansiaceae bacterium]